MRIHFITLLMLAVLGVCSCTDQRTEASSEDAARQRRTDADSAARKAGKAVHEIARESEEAARKAGRELKNAAQQAREGWKEGRAGKTRETEERLVTQLSRDRLASLLQSSTNRFRRHTLHDWRK